MGEPVFSREASLIMFIVLLFTFILSNIALYHVHATMGQLAKADPATKTGPVYARLRFARIVLGVATLLQLCIIGVSILDLYV